MAQILSHSISKLTFKITSKKGAEAQKLVSRRFQCGLTEDKRKDIVTNGKDSLDICRVTNGMWQTSGGWGRIEQDATVDAVLRYADAGLTTFDMADICKTTQKLKDK